MKIHITTRRQIDVPDDIETLYDKDVKPFLLPDESLVEAFQTASVIVAADPDEQQAYNDSVALLQLRKDERNLRRVMGVPPDELPTDDQLAAIYLNAEPEPVAQCSNCGSTEFKYQEGVFDDRGSAEVEITNGIVLTFTGGGSYGDGDDWPGVVCAGCGAMLDGYDDIEWGC